MNILISAYACEPNRGSEPGIGWKWSTYLSNDKSKNIFVITRSNNRQVINEYWKVHPKPDNLHFFYYDLPPILIWLKHHGLPVNIYYALWLYKSSNLAKELHQKYKFDIAHHLTFGVFRDASFLYRLKIPFVIGPIGGGEYTPKQLMSLYPVSGKIKEHIRKTANKLSLYNPFLIKSFNRANLILTKTFDSKSVLTHQSWKSKALVRLEIGIESISIPNNDREKEHFLYVGRFIPLKGIRLILEAFYQYQKIHRNAQLTLIGEGELLQEIELFMEERKLKSNIIIIPWLTQEELIAYYRNSFALLFPSLHDSSGNVVLEALANGLPVISLDCGGPACVQGDTLKKMIVDTHQTSINEIIAKITAKMIHLSSDPSFYKQMQELSLNRAKDFLWDKTVESTYQVIENKILKHQ